jgi:hypothetical protein
MVATLVARNANEAMMASVVGSGGVCVQRESGFCSQAVGFVLVCLAVTVKMFPHLIHVIKTFYKFCTFYAICKDNAAINCKTGSSHKRFIPVPGGTLCVFNTLGFPVILDG